MGRLAKRHTQHAWTSGGNNFRVRLLEELHCHTPTHEQLLHEGRAGIAIYAPLPVLFRKLRALGTTINFTITFADTSALLRGFKNIFLAIYRATLIAPSSRRLFMSLVAPHRWRISQCRALSNYFLLRDLSL